MLKKSIYHTAPKTHMTIPKAKMMQNVRAAFDPNDDPFRAPKQSVSEQQKKTHIVPMHGLTLWNSVLQYVPLPSFAPFFPLSCWPTNACSFTFWMNRLFVRKSAKNALKGKMHASKMMDKVIGGEDAPVSERSESDAKVGIEKCSGPSHV